MKALRLPLFVLPFIAAAALAQNTGGSTAPTEPVTVYGPVEVNNGLAPGVITPVIPTPIDPIGPGEVVTAATGETKVSLDIGFGIRYVPFSRVTVPAGEKLTIAAPFITPVVTSYGATSAASNAVAVAVSSSSQFIWTKNGRAIPGATSSELVIHNVQASDAGIYACLLSSPTMLLQPSQSLILGVGPTSRLVNVSVRGALPAGAGQSFVAGFVVTGLGAKRILLRAIGPTLARFNVPNPLQRPVLRVYDSEGKPYAPNIPFLSSIPDALASVGAFPTEPGSGDVVLLLPFLAGAYTAQVTSADGSGGEVLVEIYEVP